MKYLKALELVTKLSSKNKFKISLISSFYANPINVFLKAFFAKKNLQLLVNYNYFNTLKQTLITLDEKKKYKYSYTLSMGFL